MSAGAPRLRILAAAVFFSTGGAAIKLCGFGGWQVAALRGAVAALAVLAMVAEARRAWSWRAGLVGCAYAAANVCFVMANKLTTAASAVFILSTSPLFILALAPWLLHERARREDLYFLLVAALGMATFFVGVERPRATAPNPLLGNGFAASSALAWALTLVGYRWLAGRPGGGRGSVAAAVVSGNLTASLFSLPWALPLAAGQVADWLVVGYLGVFQLGLSYVFLTRAIPHVPALEASLLLLLEPVLSPIWAWLVHRETPGMWALLGGLIILGATAVKMWRDARASPATLPVVEA